VNRIVSIIVSIIAFIGDGAWFLLGLAAWVLSMGAATISVSNATSKNVFTFKGWS
jgi:hypothetical protein